MTTLKNSTDASVRRKTFSEKIGMSIFYDDGEDSDAYFQGNDVTENRTQVRKHRRKVNSPLSVRAPNFASHAKGLHSSGFC